MLKILGVLVLVLLAAGVRAVVLIDDGADPTNHSITEHSGTLTWFPKDGNPEPELTSRYWTMAYPAAYASRVEPGVGVYVGEERIGFVRERKVDHGSVWVYAWIAPEYVAIAGGVTESEPIETSDGPRIQIYEYSTIPPADSTRA